jgi:hypothetical protein
MSDHSDAEFTPEERAQLRDLLAHMSFPKSPPEEGDDGGDVRLVPGRPAAGTSGTSGRVVIEYAGPSTPVLTLVSREDGFEMDVYLGVQHPSMAGIVDPRHGARAESVYLRPEDDGVSVFRLVWGKWLSRSE